MCTRLKKKNKNLDTLKWKLIQNKIIHRRTLIMLQLLIKLHLQRILQLLLGGICLLVWEYGVGPSDPTTATLTASKVIRYL